MFVCFFSQESVSGQAEVLDSLCPRDTRRLHHHVLLCRTGSVSISDPTPFIYIFRCRHTGHSLTHTSPFPWFTLELWFRHSLPKFHSAVHPSHVSCQYVWLSQDLTLHKWCRAVLCETQGLSIFVDLDQTVLVFALTFCCQISEISSWKNVITL